MSKRNDLFQKLADHYEERAMELDEMARHYARHLVVADSYRAQAMAFREAAAYARQQKDR